METKVLKGLVELDESQRREVMGGCVDPLPPGTFPPVMRTIGDYIQWCKEMDIDPWMLY